MNRNLPCPGLVIVVLPHGGIFVGAAVAGLVTLAARTLAIGLPVRTLHRFFKLPKSAWQLLTWGGLRGGISVALALSIPASPERSTVLSLTYCVVVFSILVQGLTVGRLARATVAQGRDSAASRG